MKATMHFFRKLAPLLFILQIVFILFKLFGVQMGWGATFIPLYGMGMCFIANMLLAYINFKQQYGGKK